MKMHFENRVVEDLIRDLRVEVATQKECITKYSFQAMAISGALWAFAFKFHSGPSRLWLAACIMICGCLTSFLMLMVTRLINHKYNSINRNLGYELHLYRLKDYCRSRETQALSERMLQIGWEEAMCAWRVVQATVYNDLYTDITVRPPRWLLKRKFKHPVLRRLKYHWLTTRWLRLGWLRPHWLKPQRLSTKHNARNLYRWYATKTLISDGEDYHAGNYMRNTHWMMDSMGLFSIAIAWLGYFYAFSVVLMQGKSVSSFKVIALVFAGIFLLLYLLIFISQVRRQHVFRRILECELLSIQSSAVMWRLVVMVHLLGVACAFHKNGSYKFYTRYTHGLGQDIVRNFYRIHYWMEEWEACVSKPEKLYARLDQLFPTEAEPNCYEPLIQLGTPGRNKTV